MDTEKFPKLICEECCAELIVVAKFREKCALSEEMLTSLIKDTGSGDTRNPFTAKEMVADNSDHDVAYYVVQEDGKDLADGSQSDEDCSAVSADSN